MDYRLMLLSIAIAGATRSAFGQDPQLVGSNVTPHSFEKVQVILEGQFLILSDEFVKRLPEQWKSKWPTLPGMGSFVVCDQQQTDLLVLAANYDRSSGITPEFTLRLLNGEKREVRALKPGPSQTYQATISDSHKTIQVCLTWERTRDGAEILPALKAEVPLGSHLLVHTTTISENRATSYWDQFADRLFCRKPKPKVAFEQGFLLVTPRIASREQTPEQAGAR